MDWSWAVFWYLMGALSAVGAGIFIMWFLNRERPEPATPEAPLPPDPLIVPAPLVGHDTVMQWALHYHRDHLTPGAEVDKEYGVWAAIVEKVIKAATEDIGIRRHFNFTDIPALERKVTAALCLVLDKGLRKNTIEAMTKAHALYDITEREYERFGRVVISVLTDYKVPQNALDGVVDILNALRPAIVKEQRV